MVTVFLMIHVYNLGYHVLSLLYSQTVLKWIAPINYTSRLPRQAAKRRHHISSHVTIRPMTSTHFNRCRQVGLILPVEYLADAAVWHLQLAANLTRSHAVYRHLKYLNTKVVRQGAPVCKHSTVLVDVLATCDVTKHATETSTNRVSTRCCCDSRSYCVRRMYVILANYQTGLRYKFANGWHARSDSTGRVHERTQTLSTQAWPLSVTDQSSVVHEVSE